MNPTAKGKPTRQANRRQVVAAVRGKRR
jgi:hypothetical protein